MVEATNEIDDWANMMDYFKKNPKVLLDAIPTPKNEEGQTGFPEIGFGMTPSKDISFKINDSSIRGSS